MKIADLKVGEKVTMPVALIEMSERTGRNGPFLAGRIGDNTGYVDCKIWQPTVAMLKLPTLLHEKLEQNSFLVVNIRGKVDSFNDNLQIIIEDVIVLDEETVDKGEFCFTNVTPEMREELLLFIQNLQAEITTPIYKRILEAVLNSSYMEKFLYYPAAVYHHHNYIYGLLQHTVEVIKLVLAMYDSNPEYYSKIVNRDCLIISALLHDFGKVKEYGITLAPFYIEDAMPHQVGSTTILMSILSPIMDEEIEKEFEKIANIIYNHHGIYGDESTYNKCLIAETHMIFSADMVSAKCAPIYYDKE